MHSSIVSILSAAALLCATAAAAFAADFGFETSDPRELSLVSSIHVYNVGP